MASWPTRPAASSAARLKGRSQRHARAHRAALVPVVVAGVEGRAGRAGAGEGDVVEHGGRRAPVLEEELVDEGLQRRSGLTPAREEIEAPAARPPAGRAHVGEDLARRVGEHDGGAVLHAPPREARHRALEEIVGLPLDREVERGAEGPAPAIEAPVPGAGERGVDEAWGLVRARGGVAEGGWVGGGAGAGLLVDAAERGQVGEDVARGGGGRAPGGGAARSRWAPGGRRRGAPPGRG